MTTITAEMIKAAEVLVGVDYTAAERAQMLDNLEGQIASAKARRGVALANSVPMALQCHPPDPRLMPDPKGASVAAGFWAMDAPSGRNLGFSAVFSANDSQALGLCAIAANTGCGCRRMWPLSALTLSSLARLPSRRSVPFCRT